MRLRTIGLIVTLALGQLAGPLPAKAQRAGGLSDRYSRLPLTFSTTDPRFVAFRQGLREPGYVEGQNLVLEYRSAKGKRERLPEVAAELVRLKECRCYDTSFNCILAGTKPWRGIVASG